MAPSSQSSAVEISGRMLRIVLVIGFILEVGAAVTSYSLVNAIDRVDGLFGDTTVAVALLPSAYRVFIWSCIVTALALRWMQRGELMDIIRAPENDPGWLQQVRETGFGVTLLVVPGQLLFCAYQLVFRPGATALGTKLDFMLSLGLAVIFALAVFLLEQEPPEPGSLPAPAPRVPVIMAAPRAPPAPVPLAATAAPVAEAFSAACAVCTQSVQGPRCTACGAAVLAGGFQVMELLAQSSHARTYLARAPDGTRSVLKEMSFALAPDTTVLSAFEREGQLLQQLKHPRLPRFLASFTEGSGAALRFYLAYVYVEGLSLAEDLRQRRYTQAEAVELTREVLRILTYLHALSPPVIHRDIKPANLLRQTNGAIVLVDFGSARDLSRTTQQATMVGTFGYMPREQLAGQVDATSDLYALGTTVLHVLTGQAPGERVDETGQFVFPRKLQVSADFRRFLQRLTAPRRKERFPSAREALRALEAPASPALPRWSMAAVGVLLLAGGGALVRGRMRLDPSRAVTVPAAPRPPEPTPVSAPAPAPVPVPKPAPAPVPKPALVFVPMSESEPEPTTPVLARFDGGTVSEEELRERTARFPAPMRGTSGEYTRRSRLRALVIEKLLAREAARVIAPRSEWSALSPELQRRQRVRALVDGRVSEQTPERLPQERMKVLSTLGRELYDKAQVWVDEARLGSMAWSPAEPHWQPWELQAARAALNEPSRTLSFQHTDEFASPCKGFIESSAAAYDARCECESLADNILEEDALYFDLYLSGEGPNLLFASNSTTSACREIYLPSAAQASVEQRMAEETGFRVELRPDVLQAPAEARAQDLQRMLGAVRPRLSECLNIRSDKDHFNGKLTLSWNIEQGEVRGLRSEAGESPKNKAARLVGTPVEYCLRTILETWRMVAIPSGPVSVRFSLTASREHVDLRMTP